MEGRTWGKLTLADAAANWAQNGGSKGVQDIDAIMLMLENGS